MLAFRQDFGEDYNYDSNGNVVTEANASYADAYKYDSGWMDSSIGLVRFGERWYDPATGRWIAQDPTGLATGPNPYDYVGNDPANEVDPSGLAEESPQLRVDERHARQDENQPHPGNYGAFYWPFLWIVTVPGANAEKGGWIVQHVVVKYDVKDAANNRVTDIPVAVDKLVDDTSDKKKKKLVLETRKLDTMYTSFWVDKEKTTLNYWEAWFVPKGERAPAEGKGRRKLLGPELTYLRRRYGIVGQGTTEFSDLFMAPFVKDENRNLHGSIEIIGKAYFIDGLGSVWQIASFVK